MLLIQAVNVFNQGGIIAYPTESIFGLGCDPDNDTAITKLLYIKKRAVNKGFILLASRYEQLLPYVDETLIPKEKLNIIKSRWPAAITQIMPVKKNISVLLTGGWNTIAVRVTEHPEVISLCEQIKKPIISTSANISGQSTAKTWQQVEQQFGDKIDHLIKTKTLGLTQPSTIIDALSGKVIRA